MCVLMCRIILWVAQEPLYVAEISFGHMIQRTGHLAMMEFSVMIVFTSPKFVLSNESISSTLNSLMFRFSLVNNSCSNSAGVCNFLNSATVLFFLLAFIATIWFGIAAIALLWPGKKRKRFCCLYVPELQQFKSLIIFRFSLTNSSMSDMWLWFNCNKLVSLSYADSLSMVLRHFGNWNWWNFSRDSNTSSTARRFAY